MNYYTYVYIDPRNNTPFYVGKGKGDRSKAHLSDAKSHKHYNKYMERKLWSIWNSNNEPIIRIVYNGSEDFAFIIEEKLIENFKNEGIELCNLTTGGEGYTVSDETKKKLSDISIKQWSSKKHRKKMSNIMKKLHNDNPELRKKISEKTKEGMKKVHDKVVENNKRISSNPETQKKISDVIKLKYETDHDYKKRISDATKKAMNTPEMKNKIKEIRSDPEYKLKMSEIFNRPDVKLKRSESLKLSWIKRKEKFGKSGKS